MRELYLPKIHSCSFTTWWSTPNHRIWIRYYKLYAHIFSFTPAVFLHVGCQSYENSKCDWCENQPMMSGQTFFKFLWSIQLAGFHMISTVLQSTVLVTKYLQFPYITVACSAAIPEMINNISTPLIQLFQPLGFTSLKESKHLHLILYTLTLVSAFCNFLVLCQTSSE